MNQSFVLQNNLGDVTGKITSQSIAASVVGTGLGIGLSQVVGPEPINVLLASLPISFLCIVTCYESCRVVAIRTLNVQRGELICQDLFNQLQGGIAIEVLSLLTTMEVAKKERFLGQPTSPFATQLLVSPDMTTAHIQLQDAYEQDGNSQHILAYDADRGNGAVLLWFFDDAVDEEILFGFVHANVLRWKLEQTPLLQVAGISDYMKESRELAEKIFPTILTGLEPRGWLREASCFKGHEGLLSRPS